MDAYEIAAHFEATKRCPKYEESLEMARWILRHRGVVEASERYREALRGLMTCPHMDLGDLVYRVREREGMGWEGPAVKQWSDAVTEAQAALKESEAKP